MDLSEASDLLTIEEAVKLGAVDGPLYSQVFFPKTVRQAVPEFHRTMWSDLDDPTARFVAWKIFRDGAKTTLLRLAASRRVAYGISRTLVYTSNSEGHAARSVKWLRRQVESNVLWASAFGLRRGSKWSDTEIEIIHGIEEVPISVIALGITGQIRGINFDDFRPDFIVADDPDNEETSGTPEQREKASALFFGALANSLAPASESPLAKMVLAQTPLTEGDLIDQCAKDRSWRTSTFGILNENTRSRWPDRYPTEVVIAEKQAYIARNQLALWMREKECKIVGAEMASFRREWLNFYTTEPENLWTVVAIDPAFSDSKEADQFAMVVWGCVGRKRYLLDYFLARGVEPDQAGAQLLTFIFRYRPRKVVVEKTAAQRTLSWFLQQCMMRARCYVPVFEHDDKRRKADVILQTFLQYAPHGEIYVKESQTQFLEAYLTWHPLWTGHDDLLDAGARGLAATSNVGNDDLISADSDYKAIENWRSAP